MDNKGISTRDLQIALWDTIGQKGRILRSLAPSKADNCCKREIIKICSNEWESVLYSDMSCLVRRIEHESTVIRNKTKLKFY